MGPIGDSIADKLNKITEGDLTLCFTEDETAYAEIHWSDFNRVLGVARTRGALKNAREIQVDINKKTAKYGISCRVESVFDADNEQIDVWFWYWSRLIRCVVRLAQQFMYYLF